MKTWMTQLFLVLGMFFFQQHALFTQCCQQPNLVNGGLEFGVVPNGLGFFNSPSGGWTASGSVLEIWGSGFNGIPAYQGANFMELNANAAQTVYQNVATVPGQLYSWSVAHRGRGAINTARIELGPTAGPFASTTMTTGPSAWVVYSGQYTATSTTTQIRMVSVTSGSVANFIDGLTFVAVCPDIDNDGVPDCDDNCVQTPNANQADADGDGVGDACDGCPYDPAKTSTGICGCGVADTDTDSDGVADCIDNCIETANPGQEDGDDDGIGDVCDACPAIPDPACASCGNGKYLVCHLPAGNPENAQQLCLPYSGAEAHIGNHGGCYWGVCGPAGESIGGDNQAKPLSAEGQHSDDRNGEDNPIVQSDKGTVYFFSMTPNPASSSVNIHLHGHSNDAHLYIHDQLGRMVWNQAISGEESSFNLPLQDHQFGSGVYMVTLVSNGEQITRRLIVSK